MARAIAATVLLAMATTVRAAVVAAPGFAVHAISTPDTVQGGVVRRGDVILVGQGEFGGGSESIVRIDAGGTTTVATGFNSLGGFDLDENGTLYAVDNCLECSGSTTGDTLYAIPDALTRTTALPAAGQEVVPAGTIPFAFDVLRIAGGALLVTDAGGNGIGRVVHVMGGSATDLIGDLDLAGGIALAADDTLRVVSAFLNPDFSTTGEVLEFETDGTPVGTLVGGLAGGTGAAIDGDGNVLVTGVGSFGATKLIAVAPGGGVTDRATGFAFSGDVFFDAARDEALVLDFGVSEITAICRDQDGDTVCDADDDCPAVANLDQADADGDGVGDVCDPCTGATVAKAKLTIGNVGTPPGDESLSFKGDMILPTDPALDAVANGARVLVDDGAGPLLDATIPGGAFDKGTATGWKTKKGTFKYQNGDGGILGIVKIRLKPSKKIAGRIHFTVVGKDAAYPADPARLPLRGTIILDAGAGQCGDALFPGPLPAPACVFKPKGDKVQCK